MKPTPIYDYSDVEHDGCKAEFKQWLTIYLKKIQAVLVLESEPRPDFDSLLEDFETAWEFGVNAICKRHGRPTRFSDVSPCLLNFLNLSRLLWKADDAFDGFFGAVDRVREESEREGKIRFFMPKLRALYGNLEKEGNKQTRELIRQILKLMELPGIDLGKHDLPALETLDRASYTALVSDPSVDAALDLQFYAENMGMWGCPGLMCNALSELVNARFSLEQGPYITLTDIAILAGVSYRTVFNAAKSEATDKRIDLAFSDSDMKMSQLWHGRDDYLAQSASAKKWLTARNDFEATVQAGDEQATPEPKAQGALIADDVVFVPKARDGSLFTPDCRSRNGYRIGPKGDEVLIEEYSEALELLSKMEKPYWRRRNDRGRPGIVAGVSWERVPRSKLEQAPGETE